ncbi:hypothetical protein EJ05DRAFT_500062 [Pseudovirgaria hyperparasitica]|uniref:RRM domain-containing protein n=1 Tax=Pseudovirgaria hyperparasitica TaxID=470096 RepID=A0A6A6W7D3_9PEZI|nr:uncharacterized protein EJ05DRAFT_500062 [Pseudovirgaria hyperparasitica]KAF2758543.1 hypothetical protein EJ05DRAFT_500062 [Pseudovirgaria hyperparasitica]
MTDADVHSHLLGPPSIEHIMASSNESAGFEDDGPDLSRRLYIGNMPYRAQVTHVQELLGRHELPYRNIDISTDPFTGRNPGYCFVDMETSEDLTHALTILSSESILNRYIKVNTVKPKRSNPNDRRPPTRIYNQWRPQEIPTRIPAGHDQKSPSTNESVRNTAQNKRPRYGPTDTPCYDYSRSNSNLTALPADVDSASGSPYAFDRWARTDAAVHWIAPVDEGRRVYVGGLPRMPRQDAVNLEIRDLFRGFTVQAISKIISPSATARRTPENHYYTWVDLGSASEAQRAASALNGMMMSWGGRVKVAIAIKGCDRKVLREQFGIDKTEKERKQGMRPRNSAEDFDISRMANWRQ